MNRVPLVFLILGMALPASARVKAPACEGAVGGFASLPTTEAFWQQTTPVTVKVKGKTYKFAYSMDSEIGYNDLLLWMDKLPEFDQLIRDHIKTTWRLSTIANKIGVTEAQARAFILRPGAGDKVRYPVADIRPSYIPRLIEFHDGVIDAAIAKYWDPEIRTLGFPFVAKLDYQAFELAHQSYEEVPADFFAEITRFHSQFKRPNTHFHTGIPAAIGKKNVLRISRAVETRVSIALALNLSLNERMTYVYGTDLKPGPRPVNEMGPVSGVVNSEAARWSDPFPTADIEVRQWPTTAMAWDLASMPTILAQNYTQLLDIDITDLPYRLTWAAGNLGGALAYAGLVLKQSSDRTDRALAQPLRKLAERLQDYDWTKNDHRPFFKEIQDFLVKNDIYNRLTPDKFLRQQ